MVCSTPEVAVCVVGQLRTGERAGLQRQMRSAWDRVGTSCVDVFVSLGIEAVEETANHGASAAKAYENASSMVARLRPLESHVSSAPMPTSAAPGLDCRRDATPPPRLCHKGPSLVRPEARLLPCWDDSCTHCAATAYYAHASRLASCARTVRSAAARLGRRYRYFVHHRPDLWLYGMPRYEEWPFGNASRAIAVGARADGLRGRRAAAAPRATFAAGIGHSAASSPHARSRGDRGQSAPDGRTSSAASASALAPASPAAFYCAPLPASPPSDYLGIVPFEHLHGVCVTSNATARPRRALLAHTGWARPHAHFAPDPNLPHMCYMCA